LNIVTTTKHKTLIYPRTGLLFYKKEFQNNINDSVFHCVQGELHQNAIGAISTQMSEAGTNDFKNYIIQVRKNAKDLADKFRL
jgi:glycine hydroxymethyltransferase